MDRPPGLDWLNIAYYAVLALWRSCWLSFSLAAERPLPGTPAKFEPMKSASTGIAHAAKMLGVNNLGKPTPRLC